MLKQQWEYHAESVAYVDRWFSRMEDHLERLGLESWEVYNIIKEPMDMGYQMRVTYFVKRPLTEEEANVRMRRLGMA